MTSELKSVRRLGRRKRIVFSLVLMLLVAAFVELVLHGLCLISPRASGILAPKHYGHDKRGFRNAASLESADVVCLGDSQTYGTGVHREEAWPYQLSLISGKTTYSMAIPGEGPTRSEVLIDNVIKLEPKLVVEAFYSGNDLFDCYNMVYEGLQLPQHMTADDDVKSRIDEANQAELLSDKIAPLFNAYIGRFNVERVEKGREPTPAESSRSRTYLWSIRRFLSDHSRIYGLGRAGKQLLQTRLQTWDRLCEQAEASQGLWEAIESEHWRTVFVPEYRLCGLDLSDPRIKEGHRIALESILATNDRLRQEGSRLLVLLIPTKMLVFEVDLDESQQSPAFSRLIENEKQMWLESKRILAGAGVSFVDALPSLRESVRNGMQPYKMTQDGHPNARGHRVIAEAVAHWAKENMP